MIHWILATGLLLHPADTTKTVLRPLPLLHAAPSLATIDRDDDASPIAPRIGDDKVQHFFVSYAVYTFAFAGDRAIGIKRKPALADAFGAVVAIGVGKELFDAKAGKSFSGYDIIADLIGGFAAYAVMKQTH